VPVLALEVIGSLGNRVSQLGTAFTSGATARACSPSRLAQRALRGLALTRVSSPGPPAGPERVKWVIRNPKPRFSGLQRVRAYAEARARLGIERLRSRTSNDTTPLRAPLVSTCKLVPPRGREAPR